MSCQLVIAEPHADASGPGHRCDRRTHQRRLAKLFREHNDALVRFLTTRLRSQEEAKEVAQEAYVQLLGLDHPEMVNFMQAYLYRTAANLAANRIKQRVQRRRDDELMVWETHDGRSPERLFEARIEVALVNQALNELPATCREAFSLVRLQGLSSTAAAKELNLHPRRVRRFVTRALARCLEVVHA